MRAALRRLRADSCLDTRTSFSTIAASDSPSDSSSDASCGKLLHAAVSNALLPLALFWILPTRPDRPSAFRIWSLRQRLRSSSTCSDTDPGAGSRCGSTWSDWCWEAKPAFLQCWRCFVVGCSWAIVAWVRAGIRSRVAPRSSVSGLRGVRARFDDSFSSAVTQERTRGRTPHSC